MHMSNSIVIKTIKTILLIFIVMKNIVLSSGLQCEQSTHKTGRKPPKNFEIKDCMSFEDFQNGIYTEVDQARKEISYVYKNANSTERWRHIHKSRSNPLESNRLITNSTEEIPIPEMKPACVVYNVQVMNNHFAPNQTEGFVVDIRDCVTFQRDVLEEMIDDNRYNNCNDSMLLENPKDPHISVSKTFCLCITDNCNVHYK